jgi:hypothetical protein
VTGGRSERSRSATDETWTCRCLKSFCLKKRTCDASPGDRGRVNGTSQFEAATTTYFNMLFSDDGRYGGRRRQLIAPLSRRDVSLKTYSELVLFVLHRDHHHTADPERLSEGFSEL